MGVALAPIGVLIAEAQVLFREALRAALDRDPQVSVVAVARSASEAIAQTARLHPGVALISGTIHVAGAMPVVATLRRDVPSCRTIVVTDDATIGMLRRAVESGAAGFVTTETSMVDLIAAIHAVRQGDTVVPPRLLGPLFEELMAQRAVERRSLRLLASLSTREQEVLRLLVEGAGNREIGRILGISPQTARTHIQRVIRKLGVHSRLEASMLATSAGIVDELAKPSR